MGLKCLREEAACVSVRQHERMTEQGVTRTTSGQVATSHLQTVWFFVPRRKQSSSDADDSPDAPRPSVQDVKGSC